MYNNYYPKPALLPPLPVAACFTITTLSTTTFTFIIAVCSDKSMCIPSFILIGCCVSGLTAIYVPIVMYGLRLFIVVLDCLLCLHTCISIHSAISESRRCRATNFGEVLTTSDSYIYTVITVMMLKYIAIKA